MKNPKIINWNDQIYIGEHANNQNLQCYINALEDVVNAYAKPYTCERWVCTSTFGFGEGYNERYEVLGWKFGEGNSFAYVNRAFKNAGIDNLIADYTYFNHIPSGGVFEVSRFLTHLKSKLI